MYRRNPIPYHEKVKKGRKKEGKKELNSQNRRVPFGFWFFVWFVVVFDLFAIRRKERKKKKHFSPPEQPPKNPSAHPPDRQPGRHHQPGNLENGDPIALPRRPGQAAGGPAHRARHPGEGLARVRDQRVRRRAVRVDLVGQGAEGAGFGGQAGE